MKCKAPLNNMYFTVLGQVSPCWLTVGQVDQWSPDRSISDIWFGEKFQQIRQEHAANSFLKSCQICKTNWDNDVWPLAKAYDTFPISKYPSLMELELSNQCNLECTMCSGILSSGIRKNRDKLPPLQMVYNDQFVAQLREFIPHLKELRFNGGEPLAQKIVFGVCAVVAELNPSLKINIATNGTVFNDRVQRLMWENNLHFNISIDSLQPERYEAIRINGKFDKLMVNFAKFEKYCKEGNRELAVMFNPMRNNWEEVMDFVAFADDHGCNLWFNTIRYPEDLAIWNLSAAELQHVYTTLSDAYTRYIQARGTSANAHIAHHFIHHQVGAWLLDQLQET